MVWSLALCPDDVKQDTVVYGAEFGGNVPGEGSTYCIHTRVSRLPLAFTIRVLRESATFGWL